MLDCGTGSYVLAQEINSLEELPFFEGGYMDEELSSYIVDELEVEEDWEDEIANFEKELEIHREKERLFEQKKRRKEIYFEALMRTRLGPKTRVRKEYCSIKNF